MKSAEVTAAQTPAHATPSYAPWPHFESEEIEAVNAVLRSGKVNYWTGEEGRQFENEFARSCGTNHAICVANGTVALELALQALDVGSGDEVITTSRTFIASASCAVTRGALPVCAEVDRDSQNITAETIGRAITPRTKAIIAVHLAGWPCDMDPILKVAAQHGLESDRRLRPGAGRNLQATSGRLTGRCGSVFVLPGQDHDNRRRRRDAGDQ